MRTRRSRDLNVVRLAIAIAWLAVAVSVAGVAPTLAAPADAARVAAPVLAAPEVDARVAAPRSFTLAAPADAAPRGSAIVASAPAASPTPALYDPAGLHIVELEVSERDALALQTCNRDDIGGEVEADLSVDGLHVSRVGVRCKGNSSLGMDSPKKPLNMTIDAFVPGQDLWGFDVINFNNNFSDPSMLREALMLTVLRQFAPVPRFAYARVSMNGALLGVYLMVEQIDREWSDHWFDGDAGTVVRGDSPTAIRFDTSPLVWWGEGLERYKEGYEVKGREAESDDGYIALREMIRALDAPVSAGGLSEDDFEAGIWRVLDVDSALWYLAGSNLMANYDSYYVGKNYYMYLGERDPRFSIVSWDLGLSLGQFPWPGNDGSFRPGPGGIGSVQPAEVDPFAQSSVPNRPLIRRLLAVPTFRADYLAHYRTMMYSVFNRERFQEMGRTYQLLIDESARDEEVTHGSIGGRYTHDQFTRNLHETVRFERGGRPGGGGFGVSPGILEIVQARRDFLTRYPELIEPDVDLTERMLTPAEPTAADAVRVAVRLGGVEVTTAELRYRVRGGTEIRLPMALADDGAWVAEIAAQRTGRQVTYAIRVGLADGRAVFFPPDNWTHPFSYRVAGVSLVPELGGDLVINELMADNATTIADEAGEFDDWVELYNRGDEPISLAGLFLSDDPEDPWAYALPDIELEPGAHLLIWCDNDPEQGPLHAPFRFDRDGEQVALASAGALLDVVEFGAQVADVSWARAIDGGEVWMACVPASPGAPNACGEVPPTPTSVATTATPTPTRSATPETGETPDTPVPDQGVLYLPLAHRN